MSYLIYVISTKPVPEKIYDDKFYYDSQAAERALEKFPSNFKEHFKVYQATIEIVEGNDKINLNGVRIVKRKELPKEISQKKTPELFEHCTCDEYDWPEHSCPYQSEINNNQNEYCNCCAYCEHTCMMEV